MLRLEAVRAAYGAAPALFGVDLEVEGGEVVALMGRNGMGKTTTVRAIFGLVALTGGRVCFDGRDISAAPPFARARLGLGLAPEGRQIFPTLTVAENLVAAANKGPWSLQSIYALFPRLSERARAYGDQLSGGEQQMLAIGRALMTNPKLLVLDEATEGLAPLVRAEIWSCLAALKRRGQSILVIDKSLDALLRLADRVVVIEKGRVAWRGGREEIARAPNLVEARLHVGATAGAEAAIRSDSSSANLNNGKRERDMPLLTPGVTKAGEGLDNISWNILGQTYVPKALSDSAFAWHATFPPETFVPPHIHPTQDEFIYMFEGELELMLDGRMTAAKSGDLVRMPMGLPHGIWNKSGYTVKCMFWVSPTRRLYDLFWAIHNMSEQTPAEVVALSAKHEVDFLPPPDETK
jgi:branched-chain amino acid transport system ATP-binding protein